MPPKKIKRPVTYATLQRLMRVTPVCCETRAEELLMNAMFSVAFYRLLRVGEVTLNVNPKTVILREDIMLGRDFIKLVIRNSKCRQMEEIELVETWDNTCPVRALREYMDLRNHPTGPLFVQRDGSKVTRKFFDDRLKRIMNYVGIPKGDLTTHSFRGAVNLYNLGVDLDLVKCKGCWTSNGYKFYLPEGAYCANACKQGDSSDK